MLLFYLFSLLALLWIGLLLLLGLLAILASSRFTGLDRLLARWMAEPMGAFSGLAGLILRNLILRSEPRYWVPLAREEAPDLFAMIERIAQRVGVAPPAAVVLEMSGGAGVDLRGYRRSAGPDPAFHWL